MKLEEIGFYTLSDYRAHQASEVSPLWRCELLLTDKCNFKCPYCRGMRPDCKGDLSFEQAQTVVDYWIDQGLRNIRFSGGEPTLWKGLDTLVARCKEGKVEHIAISTNGSCSIDFYKYLIDCGVNDLSISLDACCSSYGDSMAGKSGAWQKVVNNIRALSKITYVTVGMVFTESNIDQAKDSVLFADSLGVSDIRVVPSAQYNKALTSLSSLSDMILNKYSILKYRINNVCEGRNVRSIKETDCSKCWLAMDDMAVAGKWHFPCIIYLREQGEPIGQIDEHMRYDRADWILNHNTHEDPICREMCLDVCVDYNNRADEFRHGT